MKKILAAFVAVAVMVAMVIPVSAANLGDLTVTNFFGEKTDMVELKGDGTCTFKLHNVSNGTNNWDNYILAIVGETGAAYTGADQEVLIIRADKWAWGGGYSDFGADAETISANFESDINWDSFESEMQAGVDVNFTLTREGNTLTYNAKIGNYNVSYKGTSAKDLPETLYFFLTGENCTLSSIAAETTAANDGSDATDGSDSTDGSDPADTPNGSGSSDTNAPKTGDTGSAPAVAALVILGSAIAAIRKRK